MHNVVQKFYSKYGEMSDACDKQTQCQGPIKQRLYAEGNAYLA